MIKEQQQPKKKPGKKPAVETLEVAPLKKRDQKEIDKGHLTVEQQERMEKAMRKNEDKKKKEQEMFNDPANIAKLKKYSK